jgi:NAD(P)-dependent dehydrogenase (short-subunit alcohol dehydrogenase family)
MTVEIDLTGKAALVTGAGAGIGREIARWLARAGASVAVLDRREDFAEAVVAEIEAEGGDASAVSGDARDDGTLEAMIAEAARRWGGLDIAVNNIGMMGSKGSAPVLQLDGTMLRDVIDQNLVITALSSIAEGRLMVEQGRGGVIINVSSGETTRPSPFMAGYGAAKAAINHLTQTLAVELGPHGIRVVAIAPGTTLTETVREAFDDERVAAVVEATPLRRMTEHDELGRLSVFLASDLARCITGQLILADAGAHLSRTRPANTDTRKTRP